MLLNYKLILSSTFSQFCRGNDVRGYSPNEDISPLPDYHLADYSYPREGDYPFFRGSANRAFLPPPPGHRPDQARPGEGREGSQPGSATSVSSTHSASRASVPTIVNLLEYNMVQA